jgi:hypothetical protein
MSTRATTGFDIMPVIVDGDECVKLLRNGDWAVTAQVTVL